MKIVRVLTRLGAGGPPIHCLIANRRLRRLGHEVALIVGKCGPADGDMSYLTLPDDNLVHLPSLQPSSSIFDDLRALIAMWRIFRRERPDIVHTHTARAGAIGRVAARLAGVPAIVHTYHGHVLRNYFPPWKSGLLAYVERALGSLTDRVCVLAPQQAQELGEDLRIVAPRKIEVIPLGMPLGSFEALPFASDRVTIGWIGRLVPIKNLPLLVEVIDRTLAQNPEIHFLIAGDGFERGILEAALPRWRTRVEWVGWVRDVTPVVARCHIMLQTSRSEGTPVSLIQGMAAARPFVATNVGGVIDMAGSGRFGIVCAENADDLSNAVLELVADPLRRRRMGEAARAQALEAFSSERLCADLDRLYCELLASRAVSRRGAPSNRRRPMETS